MNESSKPNTILLNRQSYLRRIYIFKHNWDLKNLKLIMYLFMKCFFKKI